MGEVGEVDQGYAPILILIYKLIVVEVNTARDSDNDEEITTPRRKKAKQKKDEAEPWQNKKHINR